MSLIARHRVVAFLVLTFGLSSIFYVRVISEGKMRMLPTLGLMWCPGVAALLVRLLTQRNVRGAGWGWGATRWELMSYVLPLAACLVVYGLVWLTGIGGFAGELPLSKSAGPRIPLVAIIVLLMTLGLIQGIVFALGEEIGWRGFLVPELAKTSSFTKTALLSGVVWALYHYPLILFSDYNSGAPKWSAFLAFTWMILASSFVFAWVRLKSGSLWTAAILHASHNLFVQEIFDPMTKDRGLTKYFTTEFGVGLALAYTIAAIYFWRRRAEIQVTEELKPAALALADA